MNFDRFAHDYTHVLDRGVAFSGESSAYFADYKAQYLARLLPSGFAGKVLEYGCGVGMLAAAVKRDLPSCELHGFDVSTESISKIEPGLAARGHFTSCLADLDCNYSVVILANVVHHIAPENRQAAIRELAERLDAGGKLVVFEHNPINPLTRRVVDRCPFDDDAILLRPRELATYVAGAGLRRVSCEYIVFLPRALSLLRPLEPLLSWLPLGAQYAMVAQKHA